MLYTVYYFALCSNHAQFSDHIRVQVIASEYRDLTNILVTYQVLCKRKRQETEKQRQSETMTQRTVLV